MFDPLNIFFLLEKLEENQSNSKKKEIFGVMNLYSGGNVSSVSLHTFLKTSGNKVVEKFSEWLKNQRLLKYFHQKIETEIKYKLKKESEPVVIKYDRSLLLADFSRIGINLYTCLGLKELIGESNDEISDINDRIVEYYEKNKTNEILFYNNAIPDEDVTRFQFFRNLIKN